MGLDLDPNHVFRDFVTDGVPSSGKHKVAKAEARALFSEWWQALIALVAEADPELELPNLLIRYTITGGTANAIEATPNLTPPAGPGLALFSIQIAQENTGPVTINDKPVLTSTGNALPPGGLQPGMYLFLDNGIDFRLLSDASMQAINEALRDEVAAARNEAIGARDVALQASDDAENARDLAAAAASVAGDVDAAFDTYADAYAALGGLSDGTKIIVWADEQQGGATTRYVVEGGILVFKFRSPSNNRSDHVGLTTQDIASRVLPTEVLSVLTDGFMEPGDGGGGVFTRVGAEPVDGPKIQDAAGIWFWMKAPKLELRQFGVFGSDNENSIPNETAGIRSALAAAVGRNVPLHIHGAHFLFDGFSDSSLSNLVVHGDPNNPAVLHGGQTLADTGGSLFALNAVAVPAAAITDRTLTASLVPGRQTIPVNNTAGIFPGMVIHIGSTKPWYYAEPGGIERNCGEIHRISAISGSTIIIDDYVRDSYSTSTDNPTLIVFWPSKFVMSDLKLAMPPPATSVSTATIHAEMMADSEFCNLDGQGAAFQIFHDMRSVNSLWDNVVTHNGANAECYGIQVRSSYGGRIRGQRSFGLRAAIDTSIHGQASMVAQPETG